MSVLDATNEQRLEAWLAARRQHITSTDLPAILQLDDAFTSPLDVWLDKKNRIERSAEVPEIFEWGIRLQEPILAGYAARVGQELELADPHALVEDPSEPVMAASLDARWKTEDRRPVDAKNVGFYDKVKWGEQLSAKIPDRYHVQLQAQMAVTGATVADLAVLFAGRKLVAYRVWRDDEVIAACREAAASFWRLYVQADMEPPVDGSQSWARYLASRRQESELLVEAGPEHIALAAQLRATRSQLAALEEREQLLKNHLAAAIGPHAGLTAQGFRISYKAGKGTRVTDWEALARSIREVTDEEVARFTFTKPSSRSFRVSWKE